MSPFGTPRHSAAVPNFGSDGRKADMLRASGACRPDHILGELVTRRLRRGGKPVKKTAGRSANRRRALDSSARTIPALKKQIARLKRQLAEMREQQIATSDVLTVTSEVLQAISGSGRELEPIFQEMLTNAMSICDAKFGILYEFANGQFRAISWKGVPRRYAEYVSQWRTWGPANGLGQTMLTKQTVHIPDVVKGPAYATARTYGLEVITLEIRRGEDIAPAFEALKGRAEALYVIVDPLVATHRIRINTLVLAARLPTMHSLREGVEAGG